MGKLKYYTPQTGTEIGKGAAQYPGTTTGRTGSSIMLGKLAESTAKLGTATMKYGLQLNQQKINEETSKAQTTFLTQLDTQYNDYINNAEFDNFGDYTSNARQEFDTLLTNSTQLISNTRARQEFTSQMRVAKETQYMGKIASKGRALSKKRFKLNTTEDINVINSMLQNPTSLLSYEEAVTGLADKIDKYSENQEVEESVKEAFFREKQLEMIMSYSQGQILKNPIAFKQLLLGNFEEYAEEIQDPELKEKIEKGEDLPFEITQEFFESKYAPLFAKEMSYEIRQKLLVATENRIKILQTNMDKAVKEQIILDKELFKRDNELNILSIENEGRPISFNYVPKVLNTAENILSEQYSTISKVASEIGIDPVLFLSLLQQESGAQHINKKTGKIVTSKVGALGIGQLMPNTAKSLGVDPQDEEQNLIGAARYLQQQLEVFDGDISKALAAYNAGPGAVKKYKSIPPYKETQNYVKKVLGLYKENKRRYVTTIATTDMQEKAYSIALKETGSKAKAQVALMTQQDKEVKAQLIHEVSQQIGALYKENDLLGFLDNFTTAVDKLSNTDTRKPLLLDKVKIAEDQVTEKIKELKEDPAAYIDKYSNLANGLKGKDKFEARITGQLALGIPDGGVKILTKREEDFFIQNITEQLSPDARIETIRGLQETVGPENYNLAIRQLANKNSTLHAAYWMIPQLDTVNRQAAIDIVNALKHFDKGELKDITKQLGVDEVTLLNKVNTRLQPLIGPIMLSSDPRAANNFRETAHLLARYYSATTLKGSNDDIAKLVEKVLLNDSYDIVDSGWFTDKNILVSKTANLNPQQISTFLNEYSKISFNELELLLLDDVIQVELELGQDIYEENRTVYNKNFLDIVNNNLMYIPTVTGTGVYVGYESPVLNRPMLLFGKDKKPIYIDFTKGQKALKELKTKPKIETIPIIPSYPGVVIDIPKPITTKVIPAFKTTDPYEEQIIRKFRRE